MGNDYIVLSIYHIVLSLVALGRMFTARFYDYLTFIDKVVIYYYYVYVVLDDLYSYTVCLFTVHYQSVEIIQLQTIFN
jgi:hypothetical protein